MKNKYKLKKPRFSAFHNCEVVDIVKRKYIMGIGYWSHHDTIINAGQAEEVVFLLNNPLEMTARMLTVVQKLAAESNSQNHK